MRSSRFIGSVSLVSLLSAYSIVSVSQETKHPVPDSLRYTLENCVNSFTPAKIESTAAGFQYWFADRRLADGKTVKLSVVKPYSATHTPHLHAEDEFFFVLQGTAEFFLNGKRTTAGPQTSFYCPSWMNHGIRNVGDNELRYLVVKQYNNEIDLTDFWDSAHHWYDIIDEERIISPISGQMKYRPSQSAEIADNILLYQRSNGGWPKNYDVRAVLASDQKKRLQESRNSLNTTFDNGATHSHVAYLAKAFTIFGVPEYKNACLRGLDFILSAQYPNGGWPQFYPDTSGYRKYITFNDGAMIGILKVLRDIVNDEPQYSFIDSVRKEKAIRALEKGIHCILRCQVLDRGVLSIWCQQHDQRTLAPQSARSFELASLCSQESAEIVEFLMRLKSPSIEVQKAIRAAVQWYRINQIEGIRLQTVAAPHATYQYHSTDSDRVVVKDTTAPPLWPRFTELKTGRPLFASRDGKPVYSMAEVDRERRTGYGWYTTDPQKLLDHFQQWEAMQQTPSRDQK